MPAPNEFRDLTALVTGASSGIGAETALSLARFGAAVFVHYSSNRSGADEVPQPSARRRASFLDRRKPVLSGRRPVGHRADPGDGETVDILVNNAGSLVKRSKVLDITEDYWSRVLTLNLTSAFFLSQAVLPRMIERGRGWIVNVSSLAALTGGGIGASAYAAAKGGLLTLTRAVACEFGPHGIRVNAVSPGTIDTNYHQNFSSKEALESVAKATPLGRLGTSA